MTFKNLIIFISLFPLLFAACSSTQYSLSNPPENTISFGDGGGFVGMETGYTLLENGQLFRHTLPGDTIELEPIKKKDAQKMYEKFKGLRLQTLDIEQPGNLYYFINFTTAEVAHKITWGAADYDLRSDILGFYKSIRQLAKDRKELPKTVATTEKPKKKEKKKEEETGW